MYLESLSRNIMRFSKDKMCCILIIYLIRSCSIFWCVCVCVCDVSVCVFWNDVSACRAAAIHFFKLHISQMVIYIMHILIMLIIGERFHIELNQMLDSLLGTNILRDQWAMEGKLSRINSNILSGGCEETPGVSGSESVEMRCLLKMQKDPELQIWLFNRACED